ncbi:MAG: class I SAM-dependent methyltransferase, partial [bacterium]
SHYLLTEFVENGDFVVDATTGNGYDTVFMAKLVGESGKVMGFDIQSDAINATGERLKKEGLFDRVKLIKDGHENMEEYLNDKEKASAVIFNLGYLPGGDKNIVTRPETTIYALKNSLKYLKRGGLVIIVVYIGHDGGPEEKEALLKYTSELDQDDYNVLHYHYINQPTKPPEVIAIKKRR